MANAVARRIAIRASIAAKKAQSQGEAPVAAKAKPAYVPVKLGTFASDAGKVPMSVSKGELQGALGVEGAKGDAAVVAGLVAVMAAVSQPKVEMVDGSMTRVDERLVGKDGLQGLLDNFGTSAVRTVWFEGETLAQITSHDGAMDAFVAFQVASDRRQQANQARFERLVATSKAKKAAKDAEAEKLAA